MNLFDLAAKISLDTRDYESGIRTAKKSMEEYRSDVMKLANVYKKQGMDMSEAMSRAYSEIDKSQYESAENSGKASKLFKINWENAGETLEKVASKIGKGLDAVTNASIKAGKAAVEAGEKIVSVGDKAAKTFAAIETGIGTAVGTIVKESIEGFGDFEQLVGGVETIFGAGGKSLEEYAQSVGKTVDEATDEYNRLMASQDAVIKASAGAYKTAGMSANEYMSTITSFSASLLQGLGGDTVKAAEYADKAITDMADNANKMGSDISAIQYAYQGFAKQNYVMLDNLKLGYGGSATEMARLINDSGVLGDSIEVTAETVKNVPFDQIIEAIHVIQTNLGITGTTAKEAAGTIQGSMAAARTAFQNFAVGLADGNQDIDLLFDNLMESVGIAADNIAPRIVSSIDRISDVVETRSDDIAGFIDDIVSDVAAQAPKFVGITTSILQKIIVSISENKTDIKNAGLTFFEGLLSAFEETLDLALPIAEEIAPAVAEGAMRYGTTLFKAGTNIIMSIVRGVAENSDELADTLAESFVTILDTVDENADEFIDAGEKIILSLGNAIEKNGEKIGASAKSIVGKVISYGIEKLPDVIDFGIDILESLLDGIGENSDELAGTAFAIIDRLTGGISRALPKLIPAAVSMILELAESLSEPSNLMLLLDGAISIIFALADALIESLPILLEKAPIIIENLMAAFEEGSDKLIETGFDLIVKLIDGILDPETLASIAKASGSLLAHFLKNLVMTRANAWDKLGDIKQGISEVTLEIILSWVDALANYGTILKEKWKGLTSIFSGEDAGKIGEGFVKNLLEGIVKMLFPGINLIKKAWDGLKGIFSKDKSETDGIMEETESGLDALFSDDSDDDPDDDDPEYNPRGGNSPFSRAFERASDLIETYDGGDDVVEYSTDELIAPIGGAASGAGIGGTRNIVNNITINGANYEDEDALAEAVAEKIEEMTNRKKDGDLDVS